MTTQIYNAELVELLRSNFADKQRNAFFSRNLVAPWYDFPLSSLTTDAEHFNDNTSTYPSQWTEVDAAFATDTNDIYGFWHFVGTSGETSWKYRKQMSFSMESIGSGNRRSFVWGPILFRDTQATADVDYYFGIYRDNGAGTIDETVFTRVRFNWNSGGARWRVRGEYATGSGTNAGAWFELSQYPIASPLFFRNVAEYEATDTGELTRNYFGLNPYPLTMTILQSTGTAGVTWNNAWVQVQMSRAGGNSDILWIGGLNITDQA